MKSNKNIIQNFKWFRNLFNYKCINIKSQLKLIANKLCNIFKKFLLNVASIYIRQMYKAKYTKLDTLYVQLNRFNCLHRLFLCFCFSTILLIILFSTKVHIKLIKYEFNKQMLLICCDQLLLLFICYRRLHYSFMPDQSSSYLIILDSTCNSSSDLKV